MKTVTIEIPDDSELIKEGNIYKICQVIGFISYEVIPTFTLQDLLNVILSSRSNEVFSLRIERCIDEWGVYYRTIEDSDGSKLFAPIYGDTLLEAVYEMLCYLAENNLLKK
jgi:hypothetical protein